MPGVMGYRDRYILVIKNDIVRARCQYWSDALNLFDISIDDAGAIRVDGTSLVASYQLGKGGNQYTKEEALKDFAKSTAFKNVLKSQGFEAHVCVVQ